MFTLILAGASIATFLIVYLVALRYGSQVGRRLAAGIGLFPFAVVVEQAYERVQEQNLSMPWSIVVLCAIAYLAVVAATFIMTKKTVGI